VSALVGVVGGYGAVGGVVVRRLREAITAGGLDARLRVGGRSGSQAQAVVDTVLGGTGEARPVDAFDDDSVRAFCAGCRLVVNASAASYLVVDRIARHAVRAGADYVDAGGDRALYDALLPLALERSGRRALVTAGMMPGLSGLLPRWLAARADRRPVALTAYIGVMDRLTPAGAIDYLLSLRKREMESQAVWQDGRRVPRTATTLVDVELPFFPGPVTAYPYLGYEPERLARQLGLRDVRWHSVFDGGAHMMSALSRLQGAMTGQSDLHAAAAELAAAAQLDMFGKQPYQLMLFELVGASPAGDELTQTLLVRSNDTSELTGTVCALAAEQVLHGQVAPGTHFAAEGLEPDSLVAALKASGAVGAFELFAGAAAELGSVEEGAL
jgi:Saccharopine dehydrogenase NADP binding domain